MGTKHCVLERQFSGKCFSLNSSEQNSRLFCVVGGDTAHGPFTACPTRLLFRVESKTRCCANIFVCKTVLLNTMFYAERANLPSACLSCIQSSTKPNTQQKYLNPFVRQVSLFVYFRFFTINTEHLTQKYVRKMKKIYVIFSDNFQTFYIDIYIFMSSLTVLQSVSLKQRASAVRRLFISFYKNVI